MYTRYIDIFLSENHGTVYSIVKNSAINLYIEFSVSKLKIYIFALPVAKNIIIKQIKLTFHAE